jgi:hypothetical protein
LWGFWLAASISIRMLRIIMVIMWTYADVSIRMLSIRTVADAMQQRGGMDPVLTYADVC